MKSKQSRKLKNPPEADHPEVAAASRSGASDAARLAADVDPVAAGGGGGVADADALDQIGLEDFGNGEKIPTGAVDGLRDNGLDAGDSGAAFLGGQVCGALCAAVFSLVAARRGAHWQLNQPEAEQLGGALDAVLAKYLPDSEAFGPEIALLTFGAMVLIPRLQMDQQLAAEAAQTPPQSGEDDETRPG